MLRSGCAILCLLMTIAPASPNLASEPTLNVSDVVAGFRPPWLPQKGELPHVVVVLAPVGATGGDPGHRRDNELSRMTAAYLYHLVKFAGGEAVVAHDLPDSGNLHGPSPQAALAEICAVAGCHMLVRIGFESPGQGNPDSRTAAVGETAPLSRALAEALGRALDAQGVSTPATCVEGVPSADVRVAAPVDAKSSNDDVPVHRATAEKLYRGILAFTRAAYPDLEAARRKRWPDAATARTAIPQIDPAPRAKLDRAARAVWPDGGLPIERAPWYCATYRTTALSDRTIVHFEPQAVIEGDTVVLRGTSNVAGLCGSLEAALRRAGIERIRNEMRVLPDRERLGEDLFGACVAPMALTYAKPSPISHVQTQLLYGEPLFLLDREAGYYLVQAGDGYWGWVREEAVRPMSREPFRRYTASKQAVLLRDVDLAGGRVYRGSRLPITGREGESLKLLRPDGSEIEVPASDVRVIDDSATADQRVRAAMKMLYVPYVFGGRSPIGLDCSGLVGGVSEQAGLKLARDAAQQFAGGRLVATSWYRDDLRAGDRVYFIDAAGKVHHTGLMISTTHFVHCSAPSVQISSLKKGDRLYLERWDREFFAAKRD